MLVILGMAAWAAFAPGDAIAQPGDPLASSLEAVVRQCMASGYTPGMAVAVVHGEKVWEQGLGAADLESGRKATPRTSFYIASTSKALTGTAAALLAARGELDLEASLSRALPGARFGQGVAPDSIRVRDLLTHTHGIDPMGPISVRVAFTGDYTNDDILKLLAAHRASSKGRTFQYSNLGYDLMGVILAPSTTGGWRDVVDHEVLRPLGMKETTAYRSRVPDASLAQPYEMGPAGFERIGLAKEDANMGPAGGHFSTAHDLARLVQAELSAGRVDGSQALPSGVIAETQKQHASQQRTFAFFQRHGWGLGWDLGTYEGDTLLHRFGSFPGYRSHVSFMPRRGLGVVVLVNGGDASSPLADVVATAIYDRLIGRADSDARLASRLADLKKEHAERMAEVAAERAKRAARPQTLSRPAREYAGRYVSPLLGALELRVLENGRLEATMGVARSPVEVMDAAKDELRVELFGRGSVLAVRFPPDRGPATEVALMGMPFRRE